MLVMVFVTDDGSAEGTGPLLYLGEWPGASLPANPRGLHWRYFATLAMEDHMFLLERAEVEAALSEGAPYISQRLAK